jgi:hypothetical protein
VSEKRAASEQAKNPERIRRKTSNTILNVIRESNFNPKPFSH